MRKPIFDPGRPAGRLFYCLISLLVAVSVSHGAPPPPTPPATTTISDVIYRADGSPAAGTLLITWPAFTTADDRAVPAGSMSLPIGSFGAISLALAPNQGATPPGTFYKVVYKLNDGTTSQEFWVVPTLSPTSISAIRSQVVPAGVALQVVSRQYVDAAIAAININSFVLKAGDTMTGALTLPGSPTQPLHASTKSYVDAQVGPRALDSAVVHLAGSETITGVKTFSASPTVPTPTSGSAAANKSYVDSAAGGSGFVLKAGDTMTGPLTLSGDPTLAGHASNKSYVDAQVATRALDSAVVHLTGNESIAGIKQFASSPTVPAPAGGTDASNKSYVDTQVATRALDSAVVHLAGAETITGAKAFSASPTVPTPAGTTDASNKSYVDTQVATRALDSAVVHLTGNESIAGIKQFSSSPTVPAPAGGTDASNKSYVDAQVAARALDSAVVHLTGNESIAGIKQFSSSPTVPTPVVGSDAANKAYVDSVGGGGGGGGGAGAGLINAVTDCGLVGDGVTDDGPALQTCINNNQSKTILLPKRRPGLNGDAYATQSSASVDYYSGQRIQLKGPSTTLLCQNGGEVFDFGAACIIQFAKTATGGLYIDNTCWGCAVRNVAFYGQWPDSPNWSGFYPNRTDDGILITGQSVLLDRVAANFWGRHGVRVDSNVDTGQPDLWDFRKVTVLDNQQDGFYITGSDANQGACWLCNAVGNNHIGVQDNSALGNVWFAPHTSANGDTTSPPATVVVSTATRTSNVVTIVTATSITSGPPHAGNAMTVAGVTDSSFNGTFEVCGPPTAGCITPTATSFTYAQTAANASSSSGTARFASYPEMATTFWDGFVGAYSNTGGGRSTWIQPYAESNQGNGTTCVNWQRASLVLNPNLGCGTQVDATSSPHFRAASRGFAMDYADAFLISNSRDAAMEVSLNPGATTGQAVHLNLQTLGLNKWIFGMTSAATPSFYVQEGVSPFLVRFQLIPSDDTFLDAGAGAKSVYINDQTNSGTGGLKVCSGGASPTCPGSISGAGAVSGTTLTSTVATGTAPLSVTSTTAVANLTLSADSQLPTISTAGKVSDSALSANVVLENQANTYSAGAKQTLQNSASTAGLNLASSADPSSPAQGDVWINSSDLKFRGASATQTAERQANKGAANGYASLDSSSLVPSAQLSNPAASAKGGVQSKDCSASGMIQKINTDSTVSCSTTLTSTSAVTVNTNTTSDQNLMSLSLPAGALNTTGRFLSIAGAGVYSTASAQTPTLTFKVKLCTVSGCGSGTVLTLASWTTAATTASASSIPWNVNLRLGTVSTGATGTVEGHGNSTVTLGITAGAVAEVRNDTVTAASSAIDLTAALVLQFTVATSTGSASNSISQRQGLASAVN